MKGREGRQGKLWQMLRMDVILPGPWVVYGAMMGDEIRYEYDLLTFIEHLLFSRCCSNSFLC